MLGIFRRFSTRAMGNGILNFKRVAVIYDDSFLLSRFEREGGGERKKKSRFETGLARLPFARISPIPYRLERSAPFPPRRLGRLLSFNFLPPSSRMTERRDGRRAKRRRKKKRVCVFHLLHLEIDSRILERPSARRGDPESSLLFIHPPPNPGVARSRSSHFSSILAHRLYSTLGHNSCVNIHRYLSLSSRRCVQSFRRTRREGRKDEEEEKKKRNRNSYECIQCVR